MPLAQAISENYAINELMYGRLRQIAATKQCSGFISVDETELSSHTLENNIHALTKARIIIESAKYPSGHYIRLEPEARNFINKEFSQHNISNYVKTHRCPEESYYDVTLAEDRNLSERYKVDLIYRTGNCVNFVAIALNPKLINMPSQIDKLTRLANRLRSSLTIVVSPSVDVRVLYELLRSRLNYNVMIPNIVSYTRLQYLR